MRITNLGTNKPADELSRLLTYRGFKRVDLKTISKESLKLIDGVGGVFVLTRKVTSTDTGQTEYAFIDAGQTDDLLSGINMVATMVQAQEPALAFLVAPLPEPRERSELVAQLKAFRNTVG